MCNEHKGETRQLTYRCVTIWNYAIVSTHSHTKEHGEERKQDSEWYCMAPSSEFNVLSVFQNPIAGEAAS